MGAYVNAVGNPDTSVALTKLMCKSESSSAERVNLLGAELVYSLLTRLSYIQATLEVGQWSFPATLQ